MGAHVVFHIMTRDIRCYVMSFGVNKQRRGNICNVNDFSRMKEIATTRTVRIVEQPSHLTMLAIGNLLCVLTTLGS